MKTRSGLLLVGHLVIAFSAAQAGSLHVPEEYSSITAAVSNAAPGDTVWVGPGTYWNEALRVGPGISVVSTDGRSATTILGRPGSVPIEFLQGNDASSVAGFQISALFDYEPPVIISENPNMLVEDCRIAGSGPNDWYDPGIVLYNGGTFRNCQISSGHEAHMFWLVNPNAQLLVEDCVLNRNLYPFGLEGFQSGASLLFRNCLFDGSHLDPGIYNPEDWATDISLEFENCIFYRSYFIGYQGSEPPPTPEVFEFRYTCRFEGEEWIPEGAEGPGNFHEDPMICEDPNWPEDTPYEAWIEAGSPCIGTGLNGENIGPRYGICGVTGVEEEPGWTLTTPGLRAWPNPARSHVTIELGTEVAAGSVFEIVDALGRRVASLSAPGEAGSSTLQWDTRDADGREVPSGAYFVRPAGDGKEVRSGGERVIVVR